jgi:hypothetical protein
LESVFFRGRGGSPDGKGIINVAAIETQGGAKLADEGELMDSKVESSICRGWWGAHSGTIELFPISISKLEKIISHEHFKGLKDHVSAVPDGEAEVMIFEKGSEDFKGMCGINVGVH